jgi:hypothetical protein
LALCFGVLLGLVIMKAQAQEQEDKLFINMKIQKTDIANAYDLKNATSNLNKVLLSLLLLKAR